MNHDLNFYLKWAGCLLTVVGAICTSFRIDPINIWLLNTGALSYLVWSLRIKEKNLVIVNGTLLLIYVVGLFV